MTNKQSAGVRPEVEIDRMLDEFGAFGIDWAEFSRQLSSRKARFPARSHSTVQTAVSRLRHIVRAVMARKHVGSARLGATTVAVTADGGHRGRRAAWARSSLPVR